MSGFNWDKIKKQNRIKSGISKSDKIKAMKENKIFYKPCNACGTPISSRKPVCYDCFQQGKHPKSKWKT